MSQDRLIKLSCQECKHANYHTRKPKLIKQKLELRKFCKHCHKQQPHKETK